MLCYMCNFYVENKGEKNNKPDKRSHYHISGKQNIYEDEVVGGVKECPEEASPMSYLSEICLTFQLG